MFESITSKFSSVFDKLTGKGVLTEEDINNAMREVRIALLEADVALPVVKDLISKIKEKALGAEVIKSVSPGHMVIKIVQDELTKIMGESEEAGLKIINGKLNIILVVGLQGSGKTTTTGKIALDLKKRYGKKVMMASLDIYRPAAQKQLEIIGKQLGISTLEIIEKQSPIDIAKRAIKTAEIELADVLLLDTAGRLHIDQELMKEIKEIEKISNPDEVILVVDGLVGQDATQIASHFNESINLSGIVLTRMDGDARSGAALSMKYLTGKPIKYLGSGEKMTDLMPFYPDRIVSRILGMGDIVSLVEKAAENIDQKEAEKMAKKMSKGEFDLNDLSKQIKQIKKLGGLSGMMTMLPGMGKIKNMMQENQVDEKILDRQLAIISSMTKKERVNPKVLNGSRRKRIAAGSGTNIQEVNKLLKQHQEMSNMMKKIMKMNKSGFLGKKLKGLF